MPCSEHDEDQGYETHNGRERSDAEACLERGLPEPIANGQAQQLLNAPSGSEDVVDDQARAVGEKKKAGDEPRQMHRERGNLHRCAPATAGHEREERCGAPGKAAEKPHECQRGGGEHNLGSPLGPPQNDGKNQWCKGIDACQRCMPDGEPGEEERVERVGEAAGVPG